MSTESNKTIVPAIPDAAPAAPPKPVDPASCQFVPTYKLKNDAVFLKGKEKLSRKPLQYNFPPEAYENTFRNGILVQRDNKGAWLKRYGLAPPTYAYRVSIQTKKYDDKGKMQLQMLPPYECWGVDETEAIVMAFRTYDLNPIDCIYSAIRVDQGYQG